METTALVWRSAASPLASCACETPSSSSASSLLRVHVLDRRAAAGLFHVSWTCSAGQLHSRWLDASAVTLVDDTQDANALLDRGTHEPPFHSENQGLLRLYVAPRLGRFVAARNAIPLGACVFRAAAFAVVVADRAAATYCHWCFSRFTKKAFRCGACEFSLYCSRDCLEADTVLHDAQCEVLSQLKTVAVTPYLDKETLRLTLAVLTMEAFVGNHDALNKLFVPTPASPNPVQQSALDQAVQWLRRRLKKVVHPALRVIKRPHIRETILRIRSNAHPLMLNGTSGVCGVGIFPEAAMTLNHSCTPNVVPSFDPKTRTLRFYAVRAIAPMDLVEYSYLSDLAVGRARRQETLRDGFGFDCTCRRCVDDANQETSDQEQALVTQLIQLGGETDPLAVRGSLQRLAIQYKMLLASRADVAFSLNMLALRSATQTKDWSQVLEVAETLLRLWVALALPPSYPTTETLYRQIAAAATYVGDHVRAQGAKDRVQECQRICGFVAT